jgi:hypothetical protein
MEAHQMQGKLTRFLNNFQKRVNRNRQLIALIIKLILFLIEWLQPDLG